METKIGEIQAVRKDKKAIEIENDWYNSQFKVLGEYNKGDSVQIEFIVNKGFNNIKSIKKLLEPSNKEVIETIKEVVKINDTTINTILMLSKEIYLSDDCELTLDQATEKVINSYKLIKKSI